MDFEFIQEAKRSLYLRQPVEIEAFNKLLTTEALDFLIELVCSFSDKVDELQQNRKERLHILRTTDTLPRFSENVSLEQDWKISPLPKRLLNRNLDLGDVSPANLRHFENALSADVQGIQVDFDDGHSPLWNQHLKALYNVVRAAQGKLISNKGLREMPVLMLRPRAWNMMEHNVKLFNKSIPGPLFDFGLLMCHVGKILYDAESGPYFYLSKIEDAAEAKLWNEIFIWTQNKLGLPHGSIKACVLIENILSAFQMKAILYELREHSIGLNCGIWDYAASIINKLGHRKTFILPDRSRYVNVTKRFLSSYMHLVVSVCHKHGAPATGGMSALLAIPDGQFVVSDDVVKKVVAAKKYEIEIGLDGFMVYDVNLVSHMKNLWRTARPGLQMPGALIQEADLLMMPAGGVTLPGLLHNIAVSVLFIYHWMQGEGHFYYSGAVEDSATAEISRSQIWQWIYHGVSLEDTGDKIDFDFVNEKTQELHKHYIQEKAHIPKVMKLAENIFSHIITTKDPPEFLTTYLNDCQENFQMLVSCKI